MENAIFFLAFAAVIIFGFIPVIKKKQPGMICVYSILLFLTVSLYILKIYIKPDLKPILVLITDLIEKIVNVK